MRFCGVACLKRLTNNGPFAGPVPAKSAVGFFGMIQVMSKDNIRIVTAAQWEEVRRPELLKLFLEREYGERPDEEMVARGYAAVAIGSASENDWAGQRGEYCSAALAKKPLCAF